MRTPASIAGHPIHPMLVPLPIGLWLFSVACDLAFAFGAGDATWKTVALYTAIGGIVGALLAALPGLVDLLSLPSGIKRTAVVHMTINLTVVALFIVSAWLRVRAGAPGRFDLPVILSVVGIALLVVSGWLGGKMVYEAGVGVDVPSSAGDARR
jgi:uncharacterized membrane protein